MTEMTPLLMRWSAITSTAVLLGLVGCERSERVLDIKAPGISIEVDRDKKSGRVDMDVKTPHHRSRDDR